MENRDITELDLKLNATDNVVNVVNKTEKEEIKKENKFKKILSLIFVQDAPLKLAALFTSLAIWILANGFPVV